MEKVFKLSVAEYTAFLMAYYNGEHGITQRMGQAFWNAFYGENPYWQAFDPFELFYEPSDSEALIKITANHLSK